MECSNQLGFASLIRTFHLLPHENNLTIALISIHYLYTITYAISIPVQLIPFPIKPDLQEQENDPIMFVQSAY